MKTQVEELPGGLRLVAPARYSISALLAVIVPFFVMLFFAVQFPAPIWWTVWVLFVLVLALGSAIWKFAGQKTLEFEAEDMIERRTILGLGTTKRHAFGTIERIYYAWPFSEGSGKRSHKVPGGLGCLVRQKEIRFGDDLHEAEVRELIRLIRSRVPQLAKLPEDD